MLERFLFTQGPIGLYRTLLIPPNSPVFSGDLPVPVKSSLVDLLVPKTLCLPPVLSASFGL